MRPCLTLLLGVLAAPAAAQEAVPCDWAARAELIAEPREDNTAAFANGAVRRTLIDTVGPAAGGFHLTILPPPPGEPDGRQCRRPGIGGMGFAGPGFATLQADCDPARGLIFTLAAARRDGADFRLATLEFSLNEATGGVRAVLR